jgi:penicillin-binding protein 2
VAALQTGKRAAGTVISDNASTRRRPHLSQPRRHRPGSVDMYKSIVKSSNVYYYSLANEMVDAMHDFIEAAGFRQITGIDINGEVRGVLSQPGLRCRATPRTEKWYPGETISLGTWLQHLHHAAALAQATPCWPTTASSTSRAW